MTKVEFEKKIKKLNLKKIQKEDELQIVFGKLREIYIDKDSNDIYGCFYEIDLKKYVIFYIDAERGIAKDLGFFDTENEAYKNLFIHIEKQSK